MTTPLFKWYYSFTTSIIVNNGGHFEGVCCFIQTHYRLHCMWFLSWVLFIQPIAAHACPVKYPGDKFSARCEINNFIFLHSLNTNNNKCFCFAPSSYRKVDRFSTLFCLITNPEKITKIDCRFRIGSALYFGGRNFGRIFDIKMYLRPCEYFQERFLYRPDIPI